MLNYTIMLTKYLTLLLMAYIYTIFSWLPDLTPSYEGYQTSSRTIVKRNHRHGDISFPSPYLPIQQEFVSYEGSLNTLVQKPV